jgi:hypothetical protein
MKREPKQHRAAWTRADLERLRREWPKCKNTAKLAAALGRTLPAAKLRARKLALRRPVRWTRAEDATLRRVVFEGYGARAIRAALPGRTAAAVDKRRTELGLCGVPQGHCTTSQAIALAGVVLSERHARSVLRRYGVRAVHRVGITGLRHRVPKHLFVCFDSHDAMTALRQHAHTASVGDLARVVGIARQNMRAWLKAAGLYPRERVGRPVRFDWCVAARAIAGRSGATAERILQTAVRMRLAPDTVLVALDEGEDLGLREGVPGRLPSGAAGNSEFKKIETKRQSPGAAGSRATKAPENPRNYAAPRRAGNVHLNGRSGQLRSA